MTDTNPNQNGQPMPDRAETTMHAAPTHPRPGVQWVTLIWGLVFATVAASIIWALLSGYSNLWSVFFLLSGTQWLIACTVALGLLILLLGLTAFARRRH